MSATESLGFCFKRGRQIGAEAYHLYFDRGEPFYGHISDRYRNPKARRALPFLESVVHLGESNMRDVPALQIADLFAWCINHNNYVVRDWHGALHSLPWLGSQHRQLLSGMKGVQPVQPGGQKPLLPAAFVTQQLRDVEEDIESISGYISCNPPETTGELLKLRELQRKYREIAARIRIEIVKLG